MKSGRGKIGRVKGGYWIAKNVVRSMGFRLVTMINSPADYNRIFINSILPLHHLTIDHFSNSIIILYSI